MGVLALASCSSSEPSLDSDADLIVELWDGFSASWEAGLDTAYDFIAEHNYPDLGCSAQDLRDHFDFAEDYEAGFVVNRATIAPDDVWELSLIGGRPDGRVYVMDGTLTLGPAGDSQIARVHTTVIGDRAYLFFQCREVVTPRSGR
jgi:hypothetical protein